MRASIRTPLRAPVCGCRNRRARRWRSWSRARVILSRGYVSDENGEEMVELEVDAPESLLRRLSRFVLPHGTARRSAKSRAEGTAPRRIIPRRGRRGRITSTLQQFTRQFKSPALARRRLGQGTRLIAEKIKWA